MNEPTNDDAADVIVIEYPPRTRVYTDEDDDLDLPEANRTGDHTGGLGPL